MNDYRGFWDVPVERVEAHTGAASVMDLSDLDEVLRHFDLRLGKMRVYDVGCGTGRLSQRVDNYVGFDIAQGAVDYAKQHGLDAYLIDGPDDLDGWEKGDIVCCLSVFTHIARKDRQHYLQMFWPMADLLLVDILPGEEDGSPGAWFAQPADFEEDLRDFDYKVIDTYERIAPGGSFHRYYLCSAER